MKKNTSILLLILMSACAEVNHPRHPDLVQLEDMVEVTSERVSLSVSSENSAQELTDWINKDHPNRAELSCAKSHRACMSAERILQSFNIPFKFVSSSTNNVVLIYDRINKKECMTDGANQPVGCAVTTNIMRMAKHPYHPK